MFNRRKRKYIDDPKIPRSDLLESALLLANHDSKDWYGMSPVSRAYYIGLAQKVVNAYLKATAPNFFEPREITHDEITEGMYIICVDGHNQDRKGLVTFVERHELWNFTVVKFDDNFSKDTRDLIYHRNHVMLYGREKETTT